VPSEKLGKQLSELNFMSGGVGVRLIWSFSPRRGFVTHLSGLSPVEHCYYLVGNGHKHAMITQVAMRVPQ